MTKKIQKSSSKVKVRSVEGADERVQKATQEGTPPMAQPLSFDGLDRVYAAHIISGDLMVFHDEVGDFAKSVQEGVGSALEALKRSTRASVAEVITDLERVLSTAKQQEKSAIEAREKYSRITDEAELLFDANGASISEIMREWRANGEKDDGPHQPTSIQGLLKQLLPIEQTREGVRVVELRADGVREPVAIKVGDKLYVPSRNPKGFMPLIEAD